MALGIYVGRGGNVRNVKEIYLGRAGNVRTVKEVYVGRGGSVHKVWPAYTDYGGDEVDLYHTASDLFTEHYGYMISACTSAGYSEQSSFGVFTNSYMGSGGSYNGGSSRFSANNNCHWYSVGPIDTRGYNYLLVSMQAGHYGQSAHSYYMWGMLGYNTIPTNNMYYGGNYAVTDESWYLGRATGSAGNYSTDAFEVLYDFSDINEESTYLQFGGQLASSSDDAMYSGISFTSCIMYRDKPSTDGFVISY